MVQSNKWDKKAKYQYMKKHGMLPAPSQANVSTPKWTSKKNNEKKPTIQLVDSDDEWDSDVDEALISHFYPELDNSEELTLQQKIKLKQQILNDLKEKEEVGETLEGQSEEQGEGEFNLGELIGSIDRRPKKKILKARFSENLLEEYGLEGYSTSDKEYNVAERKRGFGDLKDNFTIGQDNGTTSVRKLTEEEIAIENERRKKIEQQNFYNEVKKKFGDKTSQQKVMDVDNFTGNDQQLRTLNEKIGKEKMQDTLDDDLDELLQLKLSGPDDEVPQKSVVHSKTVPKSVPPKSNVVKDVSFLDELLK
ncbi:hypothetical protein FOB58_003468 [Candida parapsilosis]|uniref:Uncharacterized protein n=2 Tax=Candida parapsilosis TaxID=5480 RepID=G8BI36_CANPC|nr:uncharacterized protein CPAR2_401030 [Candida parapsilosis]KAF6046995.1 hypothetical protein FOB60_004531 [Candida parapsilosis]KAF6047390.1 hypothetical protein FOB58_003468 [Candida parapsilosis]KAF6050639.1 hypothetical protein FOB59_002885 [Candida parapsilosis]KAF6061758.1 hypothetical protein FOB61_004515 [Candida parapsilosis]KAI5902444.1 hypothetical protein K4G60_g1585 [Candida parapsilosis]